MQNPDMSYAPERELQKLCEDQRYYEEIISTHPKVFFRPGDRTSPTNSRYLRANEHGISYLAFITKYGSHADKQLPEFLPQRIEVRVKDRVCKKVSNVTKEELENAYAEITTPENLCTWLNNKYPHEPVSPDSLVTVHTIEYV